MSDQPHHHPHPHPDHPLMGEKTRRLLEQVRTEVADQLVDGWRGNATANTPDLQVLTRMLDAGLVGVFPPTSRGKAFLASVALGHPPTGGPTPRLGCFDRWDVLLISVPVWGMLCELAVQDGLAILVGGDEEHAHLHDDDDDEDAGPGISFGQGLRLDPSELADQVREQLEEAFGGRVETTLEADARADAETAPGPAPEDRPSQSHPGLIQRVRLESSVSRILGETLGDGYYGVVPEVGPGEVIQHDLHTLVDRASGLLHLHADSTAGQLLLDALRSDNHGIILAYTVRMPPSSLDDLPIPPAVRTVLAEQESVASLLVWPLVLDAARVDNLVILNGQPPTSNVPCFPHLLTPTPRPRPERGSDSDILAP